MKLKTTFLIGLGIIIAQTLIFALLVFGSKPDPSVSIGLVVIAPFLFGVNIILAVLYFRKSKQIASLFLINSIVSPMIFSFIWMFWYDGYAKRYYTQYSFSIGSDRFEIDLSKTSNDFLITDITNQQNGTTTDVYYGKYQIKGDTILMVSLEHKMFILDRKLYYFPRDSSAIALHDD